jgi:hypothetical protein
MLTDGVCISQPLTQKLDENCVSTGTPALVKPIARSGGREAVKRSTFGVVFGEAMVTIKTVKQACRFNPVIRARRSNSERSREDNRPSLDLFGDEMP